MDKLSIQNFLKLSLPDLGPLLKMSFRKNPESEKKVVKNNFICQTPVWNNEFVTARPLPYSCVLPVEVEECVLENKGT